MGPDLIPRQVHQATREPAASAETYKIPTTIPEFVRAGTRLSSELRKLTTDDADADDNVIGTLFDRKTGDNLLEQLGQRTTELFTAERKYLDSFFEVQLQQLQALVPGLEKD